jgi:hypothetical protein
MPALEGNETNSSPLPIAATIALEMVGPIARTLIKRSTHPCPQQEPIAALSLAPEAQLHRG